MPYGEAVLQYSSLSWFQLFVRDYIGEPKGNAQSKIVVLHENGNINDIMDVSDPVVFGDMLLGRDVPSHFTETNDTYFYKLPINNSYGCSVLRESANYGDVKLEPSRFNMVYEDIDKNVVFCMMRAHDAAVHLLLQRRQNGERNSGTTHPKDLDIE